jgi:tRNA(Ile)-lysidine synthase TilS/MesJ
MFDRTWVCKDGRRMKVSEMDDSHLENAIRLVERCRRWRRHWLGRLYLERDIRAIKRYDNNLWG